MLAGSNWDRQVFARLLDYFDGGTPWQRRLWTVGSTLILRELALMHREPGTFAPSRAYARTTGTQALGPDPGVGNATVRKRLQQFLSQDFQGDEEILREIDHLSRDTRRYYLERWAAALEAGGINLGAERTSRLLAAHMLDAGPSPRALHIWWSKWGIHEAQQYSLAHLLRRVDQDLVRHSQAFVVAVLCETAPANLPPDFIAEANVPQWLQSLGLNPDWLRARHVGGLEFTVAATDSWAAVKEVNAQIENFQARLTVGSHSRAHALRVHPQVQVVGEGKRWLDSRRKVEVHALERTNTIYAPTSEHPFESALALVAQVERSAPTAAVAAGWASLETVLKAPEDKGAHLVGRRLAAIVACSLPRGELTTLSYRRRRQQDGLGQMLTAEPDNEHRSALLLHLLAAGVDLEGWSAGDRAGITRLLALVNSPQKVLMDFAQYLEAAFLRLYRQRNIVMHGGTQDTELLEATLRVLAPLVGVGFDRMAHAYFVRGLAPLELAAQARHKLEVASGLQTADLTMLLE